MYITYAKCNQRKIERSGKLEAPALVIVVSKQRFIEKSNNTTNHYNEYLSVPQED